LTKQQQAFMGKVRQVYQKDPWMTGKIKSVADKGSGVTRPGRTDRVYGILASARFTYTY
jgi:hypothetical protein